MVLLYRAVCRHFEKAGRRIILVFLQLRKRKTNGREKSKGGKEKKYVCLKMLKFHE